MESDNDFAMRVDAELDAQTSSAATHDLYTNYTQTPEAIVDPQYDSATFGETQQDGQLYYDYHNSFDSPGSQRQEPPHYAPPTNVVDPFNSIPRNDLTSNFPGPGPWFQYSQAGPAVESAVGVPWNVASTPDVMDVMGNLYPFGVPELSIVPFATALPPGFPALDVGFNTWHEDGKNVTLSMQNTYSGWLSTDAFDYWDYVTAQTAYGDLWQEAFAGYDGSEHSATPALCATGRLPPNATIVNDEDSDYSAARAACASTVYGGYDGGCVLKQDDSDCASNLNFGAIAVEDSSGAVLGRPPPVFDTPAIPAIPHSRAHGTHVVASGSSTQETPTSSPVVPSAAPLVVKRSSVVSGDAEKSSPFTDVVQSERGEALLVCACGDTFSPKPSAVDHHYDEKHAVAGCCPWKSKGCASRAQNVKEHIRDKHCRTCFICPVCLRSDFGCNRAMKKHQAACKREEAGIVFCGHCLTAWPSRAALAVHAPLCPSTLDRHPEHRQ